MYTHAGSGRVELVARCNPRTAPKLADTVRLRRHPEGAVHLFHPRRASASTELRTRGALACAHRSSGSGTNSRTARAARGTGRCRSGWFPTFRCATSPSGTSRHLVKFVDADDQLWAVKDMPPRIAIKEYDVLRRLEDMGLPAVRPAGLVLQPEFDTAILVTRYLEGSWQYRRLFMRLPPDQPKHRARLLDAMAGLLVELHRHGVFWGDCSLANTLFSRDGQLLAGLAGRRRDLRGAPDAEPRAAQARPRNPGGERGGGPGRPRRAARSARGVARTR